MRVLLLQSLAATSQTWNVGDEADFQDEEAVRLCEAGIAQPVTAQPEVAATPPKEKRAK